LVMLAVIDVPKYFDSGIREITPPTRLQNAHVIAVMLFCYASDHGNNYPTGKSSTEVFQKLIDGNYCSDPSIFYFEAPGKKMPASKTLKPENVCWDITIPVKSDDPDDVPLVFSTGYRLAYLPSGKATPLKESGIPLPGLFVAYKSNSTRYMKEDSLPDHIVENVIDPTFNSKGKKYQQLTPDGPLSP